jgi:hypothetical protein
MRSQSGLDMRNGNVRRKTCQRRTERARRIALHHQEMRAVAERWKQTPGHGPHVGMRVFLSGAAQIDPGETVEAKFGWREGRMLAGEDKRRLDPLRQQRMGEACQLDRFRPGPTGQPDICEMQYSP